MRLIHRQLNGGLVLEDFSLRPKPKYAVLSHTWGPPSEELVFDDFQDGQLHPRVSANPDTKRYGLRKLEFCSAAAARDGLEYFWIDTCCIDKRSSAELSEAITRMFEWYRDAAVCYVYLTDIEHGLSSDEETTEQSWRGAFGASRWFKRGWTLQELLAPRDVRFFSWEGNLLCDKLSNCQQISKITGIPSEALRMNEFSSFSVQDRLLWAKGRQTTREEDEAYCLQGLFEVHIPLLYGEGKEAWRRLREAIAIKSRSSDGTNLHNQLHDRAASFAALIESLQFEEIEDRLASIDPNHKDTCSWILRSSELLQWLDPLQVHKHHGFFWIKGKPGSGKSTIVKFLFKQAKNNTSDALVISFFFNARGSDLEKSAEGLYRSLICQVLENLSPAQITMSPRFLRSVPQAWTLPRLRDLFEELILNLKQIQVITFVDALDECGEDEVREMIYFFENLGQQAIQSTSTFRVCLSSRHYPFISVRNCVDLILEDQASHAEDINSYLRTELKVGSNALADELRNAIRAKAEGVFMWVVLVTRILNRESGRGKVLQMRKKLDEIPSDLHNLFRRILTRDNEDLDQLVLCLQWILHTRRAMQPAELYHAVHCGSGDFDLDHWNPDTLPQVAIERFVVSTSKGLAELTRGKKPKVQFIHESVRDFLRGSHGLVGDLDSFSPHGEGRIHERLKQICQLYLDKVLRLLTPEQVREAKIATNKARQQLAADLTTRYPFLQYAMQHVLSHADLAQQGSISQSQFVLDFPGEGWILAHDIFEKSASRRYHDMSHVSQEYIFAEFGCVGLLKCLPSRQAFGGSTRAQYRYPFIVALVAKERAAALNTLLLEEVDELSGCQVDEIKTDIDKLMICADTLSGDERRKHPPLLQYFLAHSGALALFKHHLSEKNKNKKTSASTKKDMEICLILGARCGSIQIVQYLFDAKVDVDAQLADPDDVDTIKSTLLALDRSLTLSHFVTNPRFSAIDQAVEQGREEVVHFLYSVGCPIPSPPSFSQAVSYGHFGTVKILIDAGEDLEVDFPYRLHLAYLESNKAMVKLLIDAASSQRLAKALTLGMMVVVLHRDEDTLRRLLAMGLDVNVAFRDQHLPSRTNDVPLGLASETGVERFVDLLLQAGADVQRCDLTHGTAFSRAAAAGHLNIMQLLLNAGADIDARASQYSLGNALYHASCNGQEQVVKFLLDRKADPNVSIRSCPNRDTTSFHDAHNALEAACHNGHERIVRMLLDAGAGSGFQCSKCCTNATTIGSFNRRPVDPKVWAVIQQMVTTEGKDMDQHYRTV